MKTHVPIRIAARRAATLVVAAALVATVGANVATAAEKFTVTYRCAKWKTIHFHQAEKAKLHYDTVKKLGCEAKRDDHGGHIDVSYRCEKWRQIALKSHDAAHRWEKWLKAAGFETRHSH
ncbi:MAG: hypothetical protein WBC44_19510 [Planctomycetaceae bacterium]